MSPPSSPVLKRPEDFKIMGQNKPRLDIPSKVDGSARFGIDVVVENMKYATVMAAPVFGATVAAMDADKARAMPGVVDVVDLGDAVAVVADGYWQARPALEQVDIAWSQTDNDGVSTDSIFKQFENDIARAQETGNSNKDVEIGDAVRVLNDTGRVVKRSYQVPYLAHACMEPMNAVARFENGHCDVWTGTQNPLGFKHAVADALGIGAEHVKLTNYFMGGGFGRRATPDAAIQAAKISRAAGMPVKLIWSREEDMRHDHYRPAIVSEFRAALDETGMPVAWENFYVDKHEPAEAPHIPYAVANQRIHYVDSPTHIPFGPWRSVDHSQHGFFTEAFIDELASEAGQDPYQFRRRLLAGKPRHQAVLDRAAKEAGWDSPLPKGRGRGIALQQSFGSLVAEVVEVTVTGSNVSVDRIVIAIDPGFAVSPDGLEAQMESGVIYGLTAALYGNINIENGMAAEGNFDAYKMVRMNNSPRIETHIINSFEAWGGAGEPGTPATAPALANAIYAATGTRIRKLPISQYVFDPGFRETEVDTRGA
jgi:isoquinoline 1-oxidoreductase beta subunit